MNSATWIAIGMKIFGWLKKPSTYWKAKEYLKHKEQEEYERSQKILNDINNRKY